MSIPDEKSYDIQHGTILPVVDPRSTLGERVEKPRMTLWQGFRRLIQRVVLAWILIRLGCMLSIHLRSNGAYNNTTSAANEAESRHGIDVSKKIQRLWGPYSPFHRAGRYVSPPIECNITQVNILQRHGARFPDDNAPAYKHAVHQLAHARKYHSHLKFMNDYEYALGQDDLIPLGATQSWASGAEAWARYAALLGDAGDESIFIRASDMPRVVDSAGNWSTGFAHASQGHIHPKIDVRLSEQANSTLNNDCPNAGGGTEEMNTWLHQFVPPIIKRLTKAAPGVNLSEEDVFSLMAMCPFESMAKARVDLIQDLEENGTYEGNSSLAKQKARSPFCDLFTKDEWRAFEFHGDVEKYYKTGPGNSLGPVQGVGYTNELLARLTNTPVRDNTTYNASLPFPLGRALYADFSHENAMVAVYAAIGLFDVRRGRGEVPDPKRGPHTKDDAKRVWVANRMVPFSARMVTERLECGAGTGRTLIEGSDGKTPDGTYVRIFVNDALQPLEFCGAQGDGLCRLEDFVESQGYARRSGDGDFERCYN